MAATEVPNLVQLPAKTQAPVPTVHDRPSRDPGGRLRGWLGFADAQLDITWIMGAQRGRLWHIGAPAFLICRTSDGLRLVAQ